MNILKDKGYSAACKDLAPHASSHSDLMNKVMKLFKIKGKKDKGYDSVRMASKREWERYREQEKRTGNRRGNKREQEGTDEENSESEEEESEHDLGEQSEEEEEEGTGNREHEGTKGNREQKREQRREQVEEEEEMKKAKGDSHPISEKAGNFSHQLN